MKQSRTLKSLLVKKCPDYDMMKSTEYLIRIDSLYIKFSLHQKFIFLPFMSKWLYFDSFCDYFNVNFDINCESKINFDVKRTGHRNVTTTFL